MIRIVHISDLHFSIIANAINNLKLAHSIKKFRLSALLQGAKLAAAYAGCHDPDLAILAANFIYENFADYDAIVVSGDFANRALRKEFRLARDFLVKSSTTGQDIFSDENKPTLNTNNIPIVVVPGNHDRYKAGGAMCGGVIFDQIFENQWVGGLRGVQAITVPGSSGKTLTFVTGDFSLSSFSRAKPRCSWNALGQGRASQVVVNRMTDATIRTRLDDPDTGIVWLSHFPPVPVGRYIKRNLQMIEYNRLLRAADISQIEYLLCGHIHLSKVFKPSITEIVSAGAAFNYDLRYGSWIHDLTFDVSNGAVQLLRRSNYRFDYRQRAYKQVP